MQKAVFLKKNEKKNNQLHVHKSEYAVSDETLYSWVSL